MLPAQSYKAGQHGRKTKYTRGRREMHTEFSSQKVEAQTDLQKWMRLGPLHYERLQEACVFVFLTILLVNSDCSLNSINQFVFVMKALWGITLTVPFLHLYFIPASIELLTPSEVRVSVITEATENCTLEASPLLKINSTSSTLHKLFIRLEAKYYKFLSK
jgi:hypothetical protein